MNNLCDLDIWTFWHGNGAWHIVPSWDVFVPHMKRCRGHCKKFHRPRWPWHDTFSLMGCICATYETYRSNRHGVRDTAKLSNDPCDLDCWPFGLDIVHGTSSIYASYLCHIWRKLAKQARNHGVDTAKNSYYLCDLDLWPVDLSNYWIQHQYN